MTMTTWAGRFLTSNELRWGGLGWSFFIAENAILSENRTYLREVFGDEQYHGLYGFISTVAMGSIGYSYFKLKNLKSATPSLFGSTIPAMNLVAAWGLASVGLVLASQTLPKLQIPVAMVSSKMEDNVTESAIASKTEAPQRTGYSLQVRCPFDFSDKHKEGSSSDIRGLERVSRHPGLWSFGLVSAGNAMVQSNPALRLWWMGPAAVAWLGGMHTDSRFRRGMGGELDPVRDSLTSNIPFLAIMTGKQGDPANTFQQLLAEIKPLNAAVAVMATTVWIASRGRIP